MVFTSVVSEEYRDVMLSFGAFMSSLISPQFAFLYRGISRGFCICFSGLKSISANTMLWSEMPGSISTRRTWSD